MKVKIKNKKLEINKLIKNNNFINNQNYIFGQKEKILVLNYFLFLNNNLISKDFSLLRILLFFIIVILGGWFILLVAYLFMLLNNNLFIFIILLSVSFWIIFLIINRYKEKGIIYKLNKYKFYKKWITYNFLNVANSFVFTEYNHAYLDEWKIIKNHFDDSLDKLNTQYYILKNIKWKKI